MNIDSLILWLQLETEMRTDQALLPQRMQFSLKITTLVISMISF